MIIYNNKPKKMKYSLYVQSYNSKKQLKILTVKVWKKFMKITSAFDGGNIRCLTHDSAANITLEIEKDQNSEFFQWFYFRLVGSRGESYRLRIINAGKAAYPEGWKNYRAVASYDRKNWFRVQTDFDGNVLEIYHQITKDSIYFAYFAPYTMEQHQDLITRCIQHSKVSLKVVGNSLDGVNIDLLSIGEDKRKKLKIWIIARQHPGETMAQWFIDGFQRSTAPFHRSTPILQKYAEFTSTSYISIKLAKLNDLQ